MNQKKKVLIITPCLEMPVPAVKGGAVSTLIESLIIQNENHNKFDFTVVSVYDSEAVEKSKMYKNTKFIYIHNSNFYNTVDSAYEFLESKIKKKKPRNPHRYALKLSLINRFKKILRLGDYDRVVFENMSFMLETLKDKKIANKYKGKLFFHIHNDVSKKFYFDGMKECTILSISNYLSKRLIKTCGPDIMNNFKILHNGFDYKRFSQELNNEEKLKIKENLNIPSDKKIVLFVGRIVPVKGISELTTAFNQIDRDDLILLVIGSHNFGSSQTSEFETKMKKAFSDMGDKVRFTGYVRYDEVWKYYKIADFAVLPSTGEEPAGLTIVESMAAGLPVITTISGGIPEFIDSRFGILLENNAELTNNLKKSIEQVADNLPEWKEKGIAASKHIPSVVDEEKYYNTFCEYLK
ncbi:MAG: glycosyltransferase family 4 protein [Acutalibacteraceae bacterium]|nr:glycosyltransferase family 4 protein [Acutalibacteraceae bacterium]